MLCRAQEVFRRSQLAEVVVRLDALFLQRFGVGARRFGRAFERRDISAAADAGALQGFVERRGVVLGQEEAPAGSSLPY